jgi:UPF0042 nucleotide-binding protein
MNRFVILTGLSGAGKSTGLHALEDLGFFTSDNIPPTLWLDLMRQSRASGRNTIAVGIDIRAGAFLQDVERALEALRADSVTPQIVFLDATDDVLVKRYNLTRRTHPLGEAALATDIAAERQALGYLRSHADTVLDTSRFSAKELTHTLWSRFGDERRFRLQLVSFGFKRGVPIDADNVIDLRALPNPYYEAALRSIDGRDPRVQSYVFTPSALAFYTEMRDFIRHLTQLAETSGRSSYTVALGCTGGQHRSVAVAERLTYDLAENFFVTTEHRDVEAALKEHQ